MNMHAIQLRVPAMILWAGLSFLTAAPANASDSDTTEALQRYLTVPEIPETMFSPRLLEKIPLQDLRNSREALIANFGGLCSISPLRVHLLQHLDRGTAHFEQGAVDVKIVLDNKGRVDELLFLNPIKMDGNVQGAVRTIAEMPGETSVAVIDKGKLTYSHQPDRKSNIPNFEGVGLLEAVRKAVDERRLTWDAPVTWQSRWAVSGSRVLSTWPEGHTLNVRTLVDFALQNEASAARALNSLLADAGIPLPAVSDMSPVELCGKVEALNDGGLSVWQGPAVDLGWDKVTYKGGANTATINHTLVLQSGGRKVCVSATWDNHDGVGALLFQKHVRTLAGVLLKQNYSCSSPNT